MARQAGVGLATEVVAEAAARSAAREAMERLGAVRASLAFVFASYHHHEKFAAVVETVRAITGAPRLVGGGAAGVLAPGGEIEGGPGIAVLAVLDPGLSPVAFTAPPRLDDPAAAAELQRALSGSSGGTLFLLADPSRATPGATLAAVGRAAPGAVVVGGAVAGDPAARQRYGFVDGAVVPNAHAGVLLRDSGTVVTGVTGAARPVDRPYTVTAVDGPVVREIAGRPAAEMFARALMQAPPAPAAEPASPEPGQAVLGVATDPARYPLGRGDFLVRRVLRVDPEAETLVLAEPVQVGDTVQVHVLDAEAGRQDLAAMLTRVRVRLANAPPRFGLYFNAASRGRRLFGTAHHDVTLIREALGEFPLVGCVTDAEIAPVAGAARVLEDSAVLAVFA